MVRYEFQLFYVSNQLYQDISNQFNDYVIFMENSIVGDEKAIVDGIQELIRNEDINIGDENNGYTALHWAAIKGKIKFLVEIRLSHRIYFLFR